MNVDEEAEPIVLPSYFPVHARSAPMNCSVSRIDTTAVMSNGRARSLQPSPLPGPKTRSYSKDDLASAVYLVIFFKWKPVTAINYFNIPKRTFFRHLRNKREELKIEAPSTSPT